MASALAYAATPLTERQLRMYRFGLALFLFSEAMMFVTLFSLRFVLAGADSPAELEQLAGGALTLLMWLTLVPAQEAVAAARRGDTPGLVRSLRLVAFLGVLLLAGAALEWSQVGLPAESRFGGIFYASLGFHAAHTAAGVVVVLGLAEQARRGRFTPSSHFAVEAGVLFWTFMVGVWIALWTVFYLI